MTLLLAVSDTIYNFSFTEMNGLICLSCLFSAADFPKVCRNINIFENSTLFFFLNCLEAKSTVSTVLSWAKDRQITGPLKFYCPWKIG